MMHQFLITRFGETGWMVAAISIVGVIAGLALWLTGARFSRPIITLIAVSIGALVGLRLPAWFAVPVGTWATAVGGALLLGISGYALHRMWVGAALAFLLVAWAAVAVWNVYCAGQAVSLPSAYGVRSLTDFWANLPTDFRKISPYFCGMALVTALIIALIWSRAAMVMLYSVLGASVLMIMGMVAIAIAKPSLLGILPSKTGSQIATFGAMVLFGAIVQWKFGPKQTSDNEGKDDTKNEGYLKDKHDPINQITAKPGEVRPMY